VSLAQSHLFLQANERRQLKYPLGISMLESPNLKANEEQALNKMLRKFFITVGVILVLGILPIIPMQYTSVVENPGPAIDILASFFR
jgi:hypothetical protein